MAVERTKFRQGTLRRDYHRPNRRENKSSWTRSAGRNVPVETDVAVTFQIPHWPKPLLVQRALKDWNDHHTAEWRFANRKTSVERKCFEFIRHRQTNLDSYLRRVYGASYLLMIRQYCDAVCDVYDWLRDECNRYYNRKASQSRFNTFRVVKRPQTLTSQHVEAFNAAQDIAADEPITEQEEIPLFFNQLSSLHQDRFLLLPPFLKPCEVRERRFGDNANDNWWEWEEELGLVTDECRPNRKNAQQ